MIHLGKFMPTDGYALLERLQFQAGQHINTEPSTDNEPGDTRYNYADMIIYTDGPGEGKGRMEFWIFLKSRHTL